MNRNATVTAGHRRFTHFVISSVLIAAVLSAVPTGKMFLPVALASSNTGYSVSGSTRNAFLQGQYAEVGIRANGAFGSNLAPPSGFHQNVGNCLGFRVDRGFDGWGVGTDDGDFFCPGSPYEGYSINIGGGTSFNECDSNVGSGISGTFSELSTSDGVQSVKWTSSTAYTSSARDSATGIKITQVASVPDSSQVLHVDITLENTAATPFSNIYYARTFDPDNMTAPGVYTSTNTVISQASATSKSQVRSTWTNDSFIMVESADTRSKAARYSGGGFGCYENPQNVYNGTSPWTQSTTPNTSDQGTGVGVYIDSLAAGSSTSFRISYVLSSNESNIPTAPAITSVTPSDGALSVAFTAPVGGSAPTNYEYSTDGGSTWVARSPASTSSPLSLSGLTNGTTYSIGLRAKNTFGTGPASSTSSGTPRTTPSAPRLTSIGSATSGLEVFFDAGADGGSVITNYKYATSVDGTTYSGYNAFDPIDTTSPVLIGGLSAGTYYVKLMAVSSAGDGTESNALVGSTSSSPGAPTLSTLTAGDGAIDVNFTAGSNGGSAITNYKYQLSTDGTTYGTATALSPADSTSPVTITGLTNGTRYHVKLIAVNALGDSTASNVLSEVPASLPAAPTLTDATTAGSDNITFTAGPTGGASISNYEYSLNDGATWTALSPTDATSPLTIPIVSTSAAQRVQIRAVNSVGSGPSSNALVPRSTPAAPTIASITEGDGYLDVDFTEGSNGGGVVTNIEYSVDGGTNWITPISADAISPIRISGLTNGVTYSVAIRAVNSLGSGAASSSTSASSKGSPLAPTLTSITPSDGTLTVSFTGASANGSPITNYQYSTDGGSSWVTPSPAVVASPLVITGLTNGTAYSVQIRAVNAVGIGRASETTAVSTPVLTAGAPTIGAITGSNQALSVAFTAGSGTATNYQFSVDGGSNWQVRNPTSTASPIVISGLVNGTTYSVRLRAVAESGVGSISDAEAGTPFTTPGAPTISSITVSGTSLTVNFAAPGSNGGNTISNYQYSTNAGTSWTALDPAATTSPLVISGLVANRLYNVKIRAVNSAGAGSASSTVEATTGAGDVTAPTVSSLVFSSSAGADGTYITGDTVSVTVTFSEVVTVTGSPRVQLQGLSTKYATYASGTGTASIVLSYTVLSADTDEDGLAISANTLALNSGTIRDAAGNNATLTHSEVAASSSHKVDAVAPTVTLAASSVTAISASISFTITGSEDVTCSTLSTVAGADFTLTNILTIDSIVQTSSAMCTINVTSTAVAGGGATVSTLAAAGSFSMTDSVGNAQTVLTGSPQFVTVTVPAAAGVGGDAPVTTTTTTSSTTTTTTTSSTTTTTTTAAPTTTVVRRVRRTTTTSVRAVVVTTIRASASVTTTTIRRVVAPTTSIRVIVGTTTTTVGSPIVAPSTTLPLTRQVTSREIQEVLDSGKSNLQDLSLPVFVDSQLPNPEPSNPLVIQTDSAARLDIITINNQVIQMQDADGFRLSVSATNSKGELAMANTRGALVVTRSSFITITGEGFKPGSDAVAWLFSDPRRLGVVRVNAEGTFERSLRVGSDVPMGEHTAQVNSITPSGDMRSLNLAVEVIDAKETSVNPEVADTTIDPLIVAASGPRNDTSARVAILVLGLAIGAALVWFLLARRRRRDESPAQ